MDWSFPYTARRIPALAENMVATSQPLAVQAGIRMLQDGGNAVDAALAAAICLTVVEPTSNGIGSDAFALIWDGQRLHGINGSGKSPAAWSPGRYSGREKMVLHGWDSVTVPGAVSLWSEVSEALGRLPFETLFEPAINYARNGYPVSPITAARWESATELYREFPEFNRVFLPGGAAPRAGDMFRSEEMAQSLLTIRASHGEDFYRGELAGKIAQCSAEQGGVMSRDDLAAHQSQWVEPISQDYRGYTLHEIPPNGQGLAALIALGILERWDLGSYPVDSADSVHLQIEAMKLAFADVFEHLADSEYMQIHWRELLKPDYLEYRAARIDMGKAGKPATGIPHEKGTVYLCAADKSGMMVSMIQSNYNGFGSGIVVPGTGISLHNRGAGFNLVEGHPNQVGGGKRPFHTIIPGFVSKDGEPVMSFGVMGAHMQAQGHVQMMTRIFDYGQHPQAASDGPRWQVMPDFSIALEAEFPETLHAELSQRGHIVTTEPEQIFGGAQLIRKIGAAYVAGSDHRKDGQAAGF